jgi:methyl-accepting chemotaxis protein
VFRRLGVGIVRALPVAVPIMLPMVLLVVYGFISAQETALARVANLSRLVVRDDTSSLNDALARSRDRFEGFVGQDNKDRFGLHIQLDSLGVAEVELQALLKGAPEFRLLALTDPGGTVLRAYAPGQDPTSFLVGRPTPEIEGLEPGEDGYAVALRDCGLLEDAEAEHPRTFLFAKPTKDLSGDQNGWFVAYLDWSIAEGALAAIADQLHRMDLPGARCLLVDAEARAALRFWGGEESEAERLSGIVAAAAETLAGPERVGTFGPLEAGSLRFFGTVWPMHDAGSLLADRGEPEPEAEADDKASEPEAESQTNVPSSRLAVLVLVPRADLVGETNRFLVVGAGLIGVSALMAFLVLYWMRRKIARPISKTLQSLSGTTHQVTGSSSDILRASRDLASRAQKQAEAVRRISESLTTMAAQTRQSAGETQAAESVAESAARMVLTTSESMHRMVDVIERMKSSSDETARIIGTIDEIAFQTNLLALNAAVEASRAGEAGKGFGVVAEEVRNLARRSSEAAQSTSALIQESRETAENGVAVSRDVARELEGIRDSIREAANAIGQVTKSSEQQARDLEEVTESVTLIDDLTRDTASSAESSASTSRRLSDEAGELEGVVTTLAGIVR